MWKRKYFEGMRNYSFKTQLITLLHFVSTLSTSSNLEFIRNSCSNTTYPDHCFDSLSDQAHAIHQDSKLLIDVALVICINASYQTSFEMLELSRSIGVTPCDASAMWDCMEELGDSVDRLRKSMADVKRINDVSNFNVMISDIQIWVSEALTDENTCTHGFIGKAISSSARTLVRAHVVTVARMTSNALALINNYAAHHGYITS